jgi:lycopene cyclase domain-containing protein
MVGEYTLGAIAVPALVVAVELFVLRTGLFREPRYWVTVAIVLGFQVLVDGWLTRADATVVHYRPEEISGLRWPWDIPVEDYGFGLALVTLTLSLWRWWQLRLRDGRA